MRPKTRSSTRPSDGARPLSYRDIIPDSESDTELSPEPEPSEPESSQPESGEAIEPAPTQSHIPAEWSNAKWRHSEESKPTNKSSKQTQARSKPTAQILQENQPLLPPADWIPPSIHKKSHTPLKPDDIEEWPKFSWWFHKKYTKVSDSVDATHPPSLEHERAKPELKQPQHIASGLAWDQLVLRRNKECSLSKEDANAMTNDLPLVDAYTPHSWSSIEGHKLAYFLPQALDNTQPKSAGGGFDIVKHGKDAIVRLVGDMQPEKQEEDVKRYGKYDNWSAHIDRKIKKYGAWGRYIFGFWHGQGQHKKTPRPSLARNSVGNSHKLGAVADWFKSFAPVHQAIGRIFQEIDPWAYHVQKSIFDHYCNENPDLRQTAYSARNCFCSTAILINQHVLPHRDNNDYNRGWTAMTVFGDFTGGYLCLPDLGAKLEFQPGTVILFRAGLLTHSIGTFSGQRYSIVLFNKQTVCERFDPATFAPVPAPPPPHADPETIAENKRIANGKKKRAEVKRRRKKKIAQRLADSKSDGNGSAVNG